MSYSRNNDWQRLYKNLPGIFEREIMKASGVKINS